MVIQVKPTDAYTESSEEKVESENSSPSVDWRDFASNTTLHGLRYTVQKELSIPRRVMWLLFLFAATSAYTYYGTIALLKFMKRPTKTVITQEAPTGGLKFPAVTICNLNKFAKSKIDLPDEDENFVKMGLNISGCSETREVRGNLTCGQALLCVYDNYSATVVPGCDGTTRQNITKVLTGSSKRLFDEEKFLTNYAHDLAGLFVLYCTFSFGQDCSEKDFAPILTQRGLCYTFNSGFSNSTVFHAEFEGPERGLSVLLNVEENESTVGQFSTGLNVVVHDQKTFINRNLGVNILPGVHSSVSVKLIKHKRLSAPFKSNCRHPNQLPGYDYYTKDGCIYQCITNFTSDKCGCRMPSFPGSINVKQCSCSHACSELEYESRVSYSKFPDSQVIKLINEYLGVNVSASYMRQNYIFLQVGFQRLSFDKREEFASYGLESLFGELGGNMGLFLGCSVLTLCEFIDFLWDVLVSKIRKQHTNVTPEPNI